MMSLRFCSCTRRVFFLAWTLETKFMTSTFGERVILVCLDSRLPETGLFLVILYHQR